MNKNTLKLTTGAMFIAIFAMMLIINQQTGFMFEELLKFVLPVPMAAFATKYGWKNGLPVMAGMVLISVLFGTPTTIFYAAAESLIGLVLGGCLNRRVDANKTIFLVVLLAAIASLLNTIVLASLFGINLAEELNEIPKMYMSILEKASMEVPEEVMANILNQDFLMRVFVITTAITGAVEGYIVYVLTVMILKRLRFKVEKPKSIYTFYPPKILGVVMVMLTFLYSYISARPLKSEIMQTIVQTAGMCGMMCLSFFGILGIMLICKVKIHNKAIGIIVSLFVIVFMMTMLYLIGAIYVMTDIHKRLCTPESEKKKEIAVQQVYQKTTLHDKLKKMEMLDEENEEE